MLFSSIFVLAGCASVSVRDLAQSTATEPSRSPDIVYVEEFDTRDASIRVDRDGSELAAFEKTMASALADGVVIRLNKGVAPASRTDATPKTNAWVVRGRFLRVNQGSRALRTVVGFGAGGTKMETEVEVYRLGAKDPFLMFQTSGGSGAMPGAVLSTDPISAGVSVVTAIGPGVNDDVNRTARMITAQVSQYLVSRGWLPQEKGLPVKVEGEVGQVIPIR